MNFSEFILDLFRILSFKKSFVYRALTWQLMWRSFVMWHCVHMPRGDVCVHMCMRMCAHAYAELVG